MYKENPKTQGSGILGCIPQTGICPNKCEDCFFQSGRSFLEPLDENLPNMPDHMDAINRVVRVNDGNDSNNKIALVIRSTQQYDMKFYNTAIPRNLDKFDAPVVLTVNPGKMTDKQIYRVFPIPKNLMFVRVRTNMWNMNEVVRPAVKYYTDLKVPIVLTFMAYYDTANKIPEEWREFYKFKKRTLNSYYVITQEGWDKIMEMFKHNKWVHTCGKNADTHPCKFCGNCLREYFATMERMRE